MKSAIYYIICVLALLPLIESRASYRYRLTLDGKPGSTWAVLSERAQERRARLGVDPDSCDLEVSPRYLQQIHDAGLEVVCLSRWLNTVVVMRPNGSEVTSWEALPFVTRVDTLTTIQPATRRLMKRLDADGGLDPMPTEDCSEPLRQLNALTPLYEAGYRGQGMLVAVLDAGYYWVDHFEWLAERIMGGRDLYEPMSGTDRTYTADSHGASCLSIMASPQEHGVWGTAQEASYYLVRTETDDSENQLEEDMWVMGAELADSLGADVISSSLGYTQFDDGLGDHSYSEFCQLTAHVSRGAQVAAKKGMLVCNAAGNDGQRAWRRLLFPADVEEVLTIGGVTPNGTAATFTSRGFLTPYVKPDVAGRATKCYTLRPFTTTGEIIATGSGTSFATPLIAGLCASLWSAVPALTPSQLREAVCRSASHFASPDSITGYGIPDFGLALQLAREITGESEAIDKLNADAPLGNTGIRIYNLLGQPLREPRRGMIVISDGGARVGR